MNSSEKHAGTTNDSSSSPMLILTHCPSWHAALKQANFGCPAVWALDENDLVAEAIEYQHAAIVVELPASRSKHFPKLRPLFWPLRRIFVVGDAEIRSAEKSLRSLGIADVFYAPADLQRLSSMIRRHNQAYRGPQESLETEIERKLPWS